MLLVERRTVRHLVERETGPTPQSQDGGEAGKLILFVVQDEVVAGGAQVHQVAQQRKPVPCVRRVGVVQTERYEIVGIHPTEQ